MAAELSVAINALASCWQRLVDAVAGLDSADAERPSVLGGWCVGDLLAHVERVAQSMTGLPTAPPRTPPMTLAAYLARCSAGAAEIAASARRRAAAVSVAELAEGIRRGSNAQLEWMSTQALPPNAARAVFSTTRGPLRLADVVASRLIEVVAHTDDLARSVGSDPHRPESGQLQPRWPPSGNRDRAGLRIVSRALADVLAERSPGHTVEVRIPPYAAVQVVAGPRHTRGTPPNVVQTDPLTWLRLATGRVTWSAVVGTPVLSASGERADLSALLPLV